MWGLKSSLPKWGSSLVVFITCGLVGALALQSFRYVEQKREKKETGKPERTDNPPAPVDKTDVQFGDWSIRLPDLRAPELPDVLTLHWLFKEDFPQYYIATVNTTYIGKNGKRDKFESQIFVDFPGRSQFVGFYLPPGTNTYDVCKHLPEVIEPLTKNLATNVKMGAGTIGGARTTFAEMPSTGRVYVYYEGDLTLPQAGEIDALFSGRKLGLVLRGSDWLQFSLSQEENSR